MACCNNTCRPAPPHRDSRELRRECCRATVLLEVFQGAATGSYWMGASRPVAKCSLSLPVAIPPYCHCAWSLGALGSRVGASGGGPANKASPYTQARVYPGCWPRILRPRHRRGISRLIIQMQIHASIKCAAIIYCHCSIITKSSTVLNVIPTVTIGD